MELWTLLMTVGMALMLSSVLPLCRATEPSCSDNVLLSCTGNADDVLNLSGIPDKETREHLKFDGHQVTGFTNQALRQFIRLQTITFQRNNINSDFFEAGIFEDINLTSLTIRENELVFDENFAKAVNSLELLVTLDLQNNPITSFHPAAVTTFDRIAKFLFTEANIICDCDLSWFRDYFINHLDRFTELTAITCPGGEGAENPIDESNFCPTTNVMIIDPCETNNCSNGATCVPAGQSFNCSCPPGFEGPTCGDTLSNDDHHNRLMHLIKLLEGNASTEDIQGAAELVENASGQDGFLEENPANVDIVVDSLELIIGAGDAMVTKPVVQIVNNLMDLDPDVLVDSTSGGGRVIAALEKQISNVQALQGNFSASLEHLEIAAVQIYGNNIASSITFANLTPLNSTPSDNSSSAAEANTRLYADGDDVPVNRTDVAITIPADVIDLFTREDEDPTALPVSFFIYANSVLFTQSRTTFNRSNEEDQSNPTFKERIISKVIGGAISKREESSQELSLNSAVITKFITNKTFAEDEVQCVHWSYDDKTKEGYWSMEGCTRLSDHQGRIVCSCKRLASFAVLVRVRRSLKVALYFTTLIGSIISCICLCMCLITFVAVRSYRTKQPTQIHFNLCLSLLGFYLAFLLSSLGTGHVIRCSVASAFIHFFGLTTMAWMTAEAVNMYFLFVQLRRTAIPHFVPVSCLLAYGLPAICAVVVAVFDRNSNFRNADYCFIHPGPALYYGFLIEVAVMQVTNLVIFALISRKTLCRPLMASRARENARRDEIIKRVRHSVLFWFILGPSWIFSILAILDDSPVIFDSLYPICISLQGLVMFLLLCVANPEFREVFTDWMQRVITTIIRSTSTGASTPTPTGNTSFIKPATISGSEEGLQ